MEKSAIGIIKDLKEAFVFPSSYIDRESNDIRQCILGRKAETNCKRILVMTPVFLGIGIFHMAELFLKSRQTTFQMSMIASCLLLTEVLFFSVLITWVLYFNKVDNMEEMWKFKLIYRVFWWTWMIEMFCISTWNIMSGWGGIIYIATCVIICIVPLYEVGDLILSLLLYAVMTSGGIIQVGMTSDDARIIFYTGVAMFIIGIVAQLFEVRMWTLLEYIYVTTFIDPLTGLLNRRGGNALMEEEMKKRNGKSNLGIVMMDIDFFKKYNDSLGHDAGDVCLKTVGKCIKEAVSERSKVLIRHGGEEFVAVFFDTTEEELRGLAEKIRKTVYDRGLPAPHKEVADVVTVSVGATVIMAEEDFHYENTLKTADLALYEAKENGRNQVVYRER